MQKLGSLVGFELTVTVADGQVMVNDASVEAEADNACNLVILAIDWKRLLLPGPVDVVRTADAAGCFKTFVAAFAKAGFVNVLNGADPFKARSLSSA